MSTLLTSTAVTAATEKEVATMRCTNSKEAIKYEKDLHAAMEAALKYLQKGSDAAENVMPNLIKHFKTKMKIFFKMAVKANRMVVLESISDAEAHCICDTLEDPEESDEEISIQEEEDAPKFMNWVEYTILNGPRNKSERSAQGHPSGSADKMPQGPAPTAPTSQTGGPPQAHPVNNQNRDHQDPPECNDTTNSSTGAPTNGKGPGATKAKKKASEPHPGTAASTGPVTQPSDSSKNTII